jgi:hypothetical protein
MAATRAGSPPCDFEGYLDPAGQNLFVGEARARTTTQADRPPVNHSPAVARRQFDAVQVYTTSVFNERTAKPGETPGDLRPPWYVPYASGTPPAGRGPVILDSDDGPVISDTMCLSLWAVESKNPPCRCEQGPAVPCPDLAPFVLREDIVCDPDFLPPSL